MKNGFFSGGLFVAGMLGAVVGAIAYDYAMSRDGQRFYKKKKKAVRRMMNRMGM